jgi:hypothetical protein
VTGQGPGEVVDLFSPESRFLYGDCHSRSSLVVCTTFVAPISRLSQVLEKPDDYFLGLRRSDCCTRS